MNTPPLYALIDRRRDGRPRIVSEHADAESARLTADLLRSMGAAIEIVPVTAIQSGGSPDDTRK